MKKFKHNSYYLTLMAALFESTRLLIGAVHAFYLLNQGLSLKQLALLQIVFSTTVLLADIPTGLIADVLSRKLATLLACFFIAIYYPLCLQAPNMILLIIAHCIYGIGMCFMFGSIEAWIVDVIAIEHPNDPKKINYYGHLRKEYAGLGNMVTGPLGAIVASLFGFNAIYLLATIMMLLLLSCFAIIPASQCKHPQGFHHKAVINASLNAYRSLFNCKNGFMYLLITALIAAVYQPVYHFWQPLFIHYFQQARHVPKFMQHQTAILGMTFFCLSSVIFLTNFVLRKRLLNLLHPFAIAVIMATLAAIIFVLLGRAQAQSITLYLSLFSLLHGLLSAIDTLVDNQFFKIAPLNYLATIYSSKGAAQRVASIMTLLVIAHTISNERLGTVFEITGVLTIIITLCMLYWWLIYPKSEPAITYHKEVI